MSASRALQTAIYNALVADAAVGALVGDRIYDGAPSDAAFPYITFDKSGIVPDEVDCLELHTEAVELLAHGRDQNRKRPTAEIVDAVREVLHDASLTLSDPYALVSLRVVNASVERAFDGITWEGSIKLLAEVQTV